MRLSAVADLHCTRTPPDYLGPLLGRAAQDADALLLCGDLTDRGQEEEARALARMLAGMVRIPVLAVLGNHDFESGRPDVVSGVLGEVGVRVLDGDAVEIGGVGFAGVKGFAGGFGPRALQPWGEDLIKQFVHEAVNETLKLESALAKVRTPQVIVLLHYAPIEATVKGEPPEIYPFLGSSRLEDALTRFPVTAVFHGHAHHGHAEGRTRSDTPVYNVAIPLLQAAFPEQPPFRTVELPAPP
jgi:Icc-related predicted phosphoesterase